jgi:hypothetical protein
MAITQTKAARNLSTGQIISPQLILEIDGIVGADGSNLLFSTEDVLVPLTFDAVPPYDFDDGHRFDSGVKGRNSRAFISWKKSTKSISSQLLIDKGGAGAVQNFKVELINKSGQLTELFTNGNLVEDIFGQRCDLYLNYVTGVHPQDSALLFSGVIKSIEQGHGTILIDIAHPDQFKRQELFESVSTNLDGAIDDVVTTIPVDSTADFTIPTTEQQTNGFKSYIKVNDEYMQIVSATATDFNVLRNQLESSAATAENNDEVISHYRLTAQPIEMMLRLMLSNGDGSAYLQNYDVFSFVRTTGSGDITNAIFFQNVDVFQKFQIIAGDTISCAGATNSENNFTDRQVLDVVQTPNGSYILVDGAELKLETGTAAKISIVSQFNLWPIGLGMQPKDIDMNKVIEVKDEIDLGLPQMAIDISEETNIKEFLEKEIAMPNALYFVPTARVSVKFTRPPLAQEVLPELGPESIVNIENFKISRTFGKYFYNAVTYAYEYNPVKDKYEEYYGRFNIEAKDRVGLGRKSLKIEANGFRSGGEVQNIINTISRRILDRYKFGARYIKGLQVTWAIGNRIEIGDIVLLKDIKVPDLNIGTSTLNDLLFEVSNKSTDIQNGKIKLDLIETNFSVGDRFATTSPSTNVVNSIASNSVLIEPSFTTSGAALEQDKWNDYLPCAVKLHNADYTVQQDLTLIGFNPQNENEAQFLETITINPTGTVMDFADYNSCTDKQKLLHTFISNSTDITSGTSGTVFDCDTTDLFVGDTIQIRRADFTESIETEIIDISGTTVTLENDLGFTPDNTDKVESGFPSDSGFYYRFV